VPSKSAAATTMDTHTPRVVAAAKRRRRAEPAVEDEETTSNSSSITGDRDDVATADPIGSSSMRIAVASERSLLVVSSSISCAYDGDGMLDGAMDGKSEGMVDGRSDGTLDVVTVNGDGIVVASVPVKPPTESGKASTLIVQNRSRVNTTTTKRGVKLSHDLGGGGLVFFILNMIDLLGLEYSCIAVVNRIALCLVFLQLKSMSALH
jgi:hypothetical protein